MNMNSAHIALSRLLEKQTGQLLADNRNWRVEMALKPLMRRHAIKDLQSLAFTAASGRDQELTSECVEAMINNETCFFRDQVNFALLTGPLLDGLRAQRQDTKKIRIWSAACSTGQEPYSLAMAFAENPEKWRGWEIEIIASDVSANALRQSKSGVYSQFEIQRGLPVLMMIKYFDQIGDQWVAKKQLREAVDFHKHNMLDPVSDFGKFDIILCRNMLMYLSEDRRDQVLDNIAASLCDDAMVMLGASETVIGRSEKLRICEDYKGFYKLKKAADR